MTDNPKENKLKYVVISPVRNEEQYIEKTLCSMVNQTILPEVWIVVDDGSTDKTLEIVESYAQKYDFITVIRKDASPESRQSGYVGLNHAAEIKAFNYGLPQVNGVDFDFISKLDGDLTFESDYFEKLLNEFAKDNRLGIVSGGLTNFIRGRFMPWRFSDSSLIVHAACLYRRQCFEDIGGLAEVLGWDKIDELRAQMQGWRTRHFDDMKVIHWRLEGVVGGISAGKIRHGYMTYLLGYHPLFMLIRSIRLMIEEPYIIGGLYMFWGFCLGYIKQDKQVIDRETRDYLRSNQMKKLFGRSLTN